MNSRNHLEMKGRTEEGKRILRMWPGATLWNKGRSLGLVSFSQSPCVELAKGKGAMSAKPVSGSPNPGVYRYKQVASSKTFVSVKSHWYVQCWLDRAPSLGGVVLQSLLSSTMCKATLSTSVKQSFLPHERNIAYVRSDIFRPESLVLNDGSGKAGRKWKLNWNRVTDARNRLSSVQYHTMKSNEILQRSEIFLELTEDILAVTVIWVAF